MNHLGDTNKMVETPRTDRVLKNCNGWHHVPIEMARELERELNEWKRWCKEKEQALDDLAKVFSQQQDRIKRLEEAGDKIVESGWSVQDWSGMCVVWAKAKEAKP